MRGARDGRFSAKRRTERRIRALAGVHQARQFAEQRLVEARPDTRDEAHCAVGLVLAQQERAEMCAGALGLGPSADNEIVEYGAFYFEPVAATGTTIRCVAALGDDAFELCVRGGLVKLASLFDHVIGVTHGALALDEPRQERFARLEAEWTEIKITEGEQVEGLVVNRQREAQARDFAPVFDVDAALKQLETRAAALIRYDNLAVEHKAIEGQGVERKRGLRVARRDFSLVAPEDSHRFAVANRERTHAVVLEFEEPFGAVERMLDELRERKGERLRFERVL